MRELAMMHSEIRVMLNLIVPGKSDIDKRHRVVGCGYEGGWERRPQAGLVDEDSRVYGLETERNGDKDRKSPPAPADSSEQWK